jgi:DedD protein
MAARSTSRFKQKPAVPFGDFMLPILGVIALGIVIVGIRILWAPSAPTSTRVPQPRPTQSAQQVQSSSEKKPDAASAERLRVTKKEAVRDDVVAKPVERGANQNPQPGGSDKSGKKTVADKRPPKAAQQDQRENTVVRLQPKRVENSPSPAVVSGGRIDNSLFIVQCGSYTESAAANSVVAALKNIGYTAVIRRAEVRGKTYYRVIVAGGRERGVADEIAKRVHAAGYPVLVRQNQ